MTDYTYLIARLRSDKRNAGPNEAADALEAQARRIAELEEVHEANLKAIQINADVFADGMKKMIALCDTKDARIAELEAALKPFADAEKYLSIEDLTVGDFRAARAAYVGKKG